MSQALGWKLIAAWALACTLAACSSVGPLAEGRHAPGLHYQRIENLPDSLVHVLRIDLQDHSLQLMLSAESERGSSVAQMPSSLDALASINASFFDRHFVPRGLTVSNGHAWRPVLAEQNSPLLACDAQNRCVIQLTPPFVSLPEWRNVVAGTPWLLDAGRQRSAADDATCAALCAQAHPRSAVGLDASGRYMYWVAAEGRRPPQMGLSLRQLSALMAELGCHQALNLDGGGSSTLLIDGQVVMARPFNEPALRKVANALHIHTRTTP